LKTKRKIEGDNKAQKELQKIFGLYTRTILSSLAAYPWVFTGNTDITPPQYFAPLLQVINDYSADTVS
jgi:hypothetical protein